MTETDELVERFEAERGYLHALARRMLGADADADDAVQEAWLRLNRTDAAEIDNLRAWLTTTTSRICLDQLRSRGTRREDPLEVRWPQVEARTADSGTPEEEVVLAETVGLALYLVLDALNPAERLAFVLHDLFAVPFDAIAAMLGRSPAATKQLASRARARIRLGTPPAGPDQTGDHAIVEAFFAAARAGDFDALLRLLDADVAMDIDTATARLLVQGASAVAGRASAFARPDAVVRLVTVGERPGVLITVDAAPVSLMDFTVTDGRIVAIHSLSDPDRIRDVLPTWMPSS